ncbi:MAG: lactate utilization protein [Oscillospiraceae bacterium]|nr:lactate utilization protein [Oscillospiraceae bacterium]
MNKIIRNTLESLEKNNMVGYFVNESSELPALLSQLIPKGASVGCGDSVTLEETGVFEFLRRGDYDFYDKHQLGLTSEDKQAIYLKNFSVDIFITGTSAVTVDGKLFNIDGNGSRVAPMIYGPPCVIVVVGVNKLVSGIDAAIERVRQVAAPLDAKRLGKKTPCVTLGRCIDCNHKQRICNSFVLITGQFAAGRIKVVILGEELGY